MTVSLYPVMVWLTADVTFAVCVSFFVKENNNLVKGNNNSYFVERAMD